MGKKFIILTVFIRTDRHRQGIGRLLIEAVEAFARQNGGEELRIPASVYGCEFYRKLGYDYYQGQAVQNDAGQYPLVKYFDPA